LPLRTATRRGLAGGLAGLAVVNMPGLWTGAFVDPALVRDQDPPVAWKSAAEALDASGTDGRVLQLPGAEFGAFRWGYTVDQPLPGLTEKPLVTRDLRVTAADTVAVDDTDHRALLVSLEVPGTLTAGD